MQGLLALALAFALALATKQRPGDPLLDSIVKRVSDAAAATRSSYEQKQASKLDTVGMKAMTRINAKVEEDIFRRFQSVRTPVFAFKGCTALSIGARLGAEVRAFTRMGSLSLGYDFNPGERNPWVTWGNGSPMQYASQVFDFVYTNILDHISDRKSLFREVARTLKQPHGRFITHVDRAPDKYAVHNSSGPTFLIDLEHDMEAGGLVIESRRLYEYKHKYSNIVLNAPEFPERHDQSITYPRIRTRVIYTHYGSWEYTESAKLMA
ncbi:hypothetical protein T492DRAFT_1138540 [Pavlovales sp. CCMP2436]|nr:hypothetical protein T492DRAFT_1138540 [Pavlovales sp. CCMP2436]|mmetsp:Transcript_6478/g.16866  ORF Transcript_6478/g.16866 Transcript_6478/m.16866 type:complete len:266 (-) Transcript_6478:221-1018(-)